jgi:SulP family sulfate permease
MGLANLGVGIFAGMPVCHGAGGLAAHFRFGARTGGSNIMIGLLFVIIALFFGKIGINLLSCIPNAVLGVLLFFAGIELVLLLKDVKGRNDLFIAFLIAGISLATNNMGIAFMAGIFIERIIKARSIEV